MSQVFQMLPCCHGTRCFQWQKHKQDSYCGILLQLRRQENIYWKVQKKPQTTSCTKQFKETTICEQIFVFLIKTLPIYILVTVGQLLELLHCHWLFLNVVLCEESRLASDHLLNWSRNHQIFDIIIMFSWPPLLWWDNL